MLKNENKYVFEFKAAEQIYSESSVKISVVNTINDLKDFHKVPWIVYHKDPYWVAPFWKELKDLFRSRNPFWSHAESKLFIAYKDNKAVGRVAAIIDYAYCKNIREKIGYFGFFECIKDSEIGLKLLEKAQEWLISKGMSIMQGPINGRVDLGCGFLYEGFDIAPSIIGSYSPKYYNDFSVNFGMKKSRDLLVYYLDLKPSIPEYIKEAAERCKANGVKIRRFNRFRLKKEMNWWVDLMKDIFSEHWGYISVSDEEVKTRFGVKQARWFVDSSLFLVAEIDNKPIAFKWSTPDYNQIFKKLDGKLGIVEIIKFLWYKRRINQGKFNFVGIKKEYRSLGIGSCMNYYTMLEMKKRAYNGAECGWIDEHNTASIRTIEKTGAKLYKKYRVYEKIIS